MATKEFISSAGSGVLHHRRAREDAEFAARHGTSGAKRKSSKIIKNKQTEPI